MNKSNIIIAYRGTSDELEEEFEGRVNYLGLSTAIKDLWKSSPFGEKWFWTYITKEQQLSYIAKIDGFKEHPKDKLAKNYKNAEKFNSAKGWEWENQYIKYAYRVCNLYKLHSPIPRKLLEEKYGVKGNIRRPIYSEVDWETLTEDVEINNQIKIF